MKVNPYIFRAYDIRGIYPAEINEQVAYLVGRAFVKFLGKRNPRIAVGRDNRLSSPSLFRSLKKGLLEEGAEVIDMGLSTTPMLYFSVAHFQFDGGIEITASHLPKEWNGFKLVREKAIPISEKTGIRKIKEIVERIKGKGMGKGKLFSKNILKEYLKFNFKDFQLSNFQPLKVVIDTGNAIAGILISPLKEGLKIKIFPLFEKLDGHFPNHSPNPLIEENLKFLKKEVRGKRAHFGVAFDGDGDRIIFLDEEGRIIPGDLITCLISKSILTQKPHQKILYDIRSSNIVRETIKKEKGIPIISRIGHSFIKEKMRKEDIIFGGEFSGHYYLKGHYFCEAPIFVLLKILETVSKTKKSLSDLVGPFKKYFHSGEINFKVKSKKEILSGLEKKYKKSKISHLDGLRVDFKNWWFLARPSQTEPLLRLVLEARTKELLEKKKKELRGLIEPSS
jgi:phosphomannomutase